MLRSQFLKIGTHKYLDDDIKMCRGITSSYVIYICDRDINDYNFLI
jgi:hypothetical protein